MAIVSIHDRRDSTSPTLQQVGGKGLSLIRMTGAGLAVPGGIVLTTEFFGPWLKALRSTDPWQRLKTTTDLEATCNALKEHAEQLTIDDQQQAWIRDALAEFPEGTLFAVRSSSPEEDLDGSSFAGGYETVLGVTQSGLAEAVRTAFRSCLDARVAIYKRAHGFDVHEPRIAIIIQKQVASDIAGVAFSINPLHNDHDEAVLNASWGLGESVVAGLVSPDQVTIDKTQRRVVEYLIGAKESAIWLTDGGGTAQREDERHDQPALTDEQALQVTDELQRIEQLYGKPMDIEWAYEGDSLYLLQARPITSHMPLIDELATAPGERKRLYLDVTISVQGLLEPMSVMATSVLRRMITHAGQEMFGRVFDRVEDAIPIAVAGRLYLNVSNVLALTTKEKLARFFDEMDSIAATALRSIDEDTYRNVRFSRRRLMLGALWRMRPRLVGAWVAARSPERARERCLKLAAVTAAHIEARCAADPPLTELVDSIFEATAKLIFRGTLPLVGMSRRALAKIRAMCPDESLATHVQRIDLSLPGNVTVEMGLALDDLAKLLPDGEADALLADLWRGKLPKSFTDAWSDFLSDYGHRGPRELDVAAPRYRDEPRMLFEIMVRMRDVDADHSSRVVHERCQEQRQAACQALCDHLGNNRASRKLREHYAVLTTLGGLRETHKFYVILAIDKIRTRLLAEADQLVRAGRLDRVEQVFDLTLADIEGAKTDPTMDLRACASQRRSLHDRLAAVPRLPRLIDSRGRIHRGARKRSTNPNEVLGQPISAGTATGRVKVLHSPNEKPLLPGEILVARATDPGWTPLFVHAGAIVLEVGGVLQHGALVAREYGKPCVAGVDRATEVLKDGELVEVDGTTGIIRRIT